MKRVFHIFRLYCTLVLISLLPVQSAIAGERLAVLKIEDTVLPERLLNQISDGIRSGVLSAVKSGDSAIEIMTRESMLANLDDMGIDPTCVEDASCEVETARLIGADFVITATVLNVDSTYLLSGNLHESSRGSLLATAQLEFDSKLRLITGAPSLGETLMAQGLGLYASSSAVSTSAVSGTEGKIGGGSQLMSAKRSSIITFESTPSGAVVMVDGRLICPATPCSKQVAEGSHRVSMQAEQYHAAEETVTISKDRTVSLSLKAAFATLKINTLPDGLPISFGGEQQGKGPMNERVNPGVYEVTVETPCYALTGERVVLNEGDSRSLTITPSLREAGVEISVTDDDGNAVRATVYADGVDVGSAPGQVVVPLCTKELKVEAVDGLVWTGTAKLREGAYVALPVVVKSGGTNSIGMSFVAIPAGTYKIGCTAGQSGCVSDEKPAHNVKLTQSFSMMTTEVTQGQYRAVTGKNPSHFSQCGENCPVEYVSWVDAVKFANALSKSEGLSACYRINGDDVKLSNGLDCEGYRLPTEAEWEVAARGGADTLYAGSDDLELFFTGSDDLDSVGWYKDNSGSKTHPVGQKRANGYGLYDMSGNVREWTWDWYDSDYYRSSRRTDPQGPSNGSIRVYRGGSWVNGAEYTRVSYRFRYRPGNRSDSLGFRLARTNP